MKSCRLTLTVIMHFSYRKAALSLTPWSGFRETNVNMLRLLSHEAGLLCSTTTVVSTTYALRIEQRGEGGCTGHERRYTPTRRTGRKEEDTHSSWLPLLVRRRKHQLILLRCLLVHKVRERVAVLLRTYMV